MRTKMITGNLIAVLVVGLVSYFVVSAQIESAFIEEAHGRIAADHATLDRLWRLSGLELSEQAIAQAGEDDTRDIFSAMDEAGQRTRAHLRATAILDWLGRRNRSRGGAAELVVITDDRGVVIARSQDRNRMYGENITQQLSTLSRVLETGQSATDIWAFSSGQDKVLQAAIAPIREPDGSITGAVVVAYDMSNGMATRMGEFVGRDVAFVTEDAVYSASLPSDEVEQLRAGLFDGSHAAATQAALTDGSTSDPWPVTLGDADYEGVIGGLSAAASTHVAYVVLANRTAQAEKASPVNTILVLTGLGVLIVVIFGFLLATSFLKPLEEMEEGILAVINGRTDLRLDIESAELGGLAYRINQLLNVFTGTPEEDSEGRVSSPPEAWSAPEPAADEAPKADSGDEEDDSELAVKLAAEPEDAYYERLFTEYVAAKEAAGENVSNVTSDRFIQRLKANEKSLMKKHDCRMVRFEVQTRGSQVNLRPVVIH